jgi:hypothetical protein
MSIGNRDPMEAAEQHARTGENERGCHDAEGDRQS